MRALVLGGAGAVCKETTRDLSATSTYQEIVVADFNLSAAQALVAEIADSRLSPLFFDAEKYQSMLDLFPGFDVVINGLPWKYDLAVTKACIEVGICGLDVSTEQSQWDYDSDAKRKGIVFIPGVGATPGITNAMAKRAADQLDEVRDIQIYFAAFRCPAPAPGLLTTFLWEFHPETSERLFYQDGEFIWAGPFEGLRIIDFPGPIGEQEVCYIPHPETRSMPRTLGAKNVSVRGCFPPQAMRIGKVMLDWGLYSDEKVSLRGIEATPYELMYDLLLAIPETKQTPLWAYGLVVDVYGTQDGRSVKIRQWNRHPPQETWGGPAAYYKNIAIPLSIGAQMITNGQVTARGVLAPEEALDADIFLDELAKRDIRVEMKVEEIS